MSDLTTLERSPTRAAKTIFTILGGTTIPERAATVRAHCREGSHVELRRQTDAKGDGSRIDVWLECRSLVGFIKAWKKIGHVPLDTAAALLPADDANSTVVAYGTVKSVYAPEGRGEAAVSVEISPLAGS